MKCFRCGKKGTQAWTINICADGNKKREFKVCQSCDIQLNAIVLIFMGFRNWKSKIDKYKPNEIRF